MSKELKREEYQKTFAFKFFQWLRGEKDLYVGEVEINPNHKRRYVNRAENKINSEEDVILVQNNTERTSKKVRRLYEIFSVVFCLVFVLLLLQVVSFLPETGATAKPDNNEVATRYIEEGVKDTGAVNMVSGMILTYRAFDTFGETNVLFIATCCVMVLLMIDEKVLEKQEENGDTDSAHEPEDDLILRGCSMFLVPVILLFGIAVVLNGHLTPGGGFSGGAIIGAGLILYNCAFGFKKTQRFFNEEIYKVAKITALCMYGLIGSYFYITGANGIANHIPLGIPGRILSAGIILPIDICVGLEVACTMYAFYALFKRGGL